MVKIAGIHIMMIFWGYEGTMEYDGGEKGEGINILLGHDGNYGEDIRK